MKPEDRSLSGVGSILNITTASVDNTVKNDLNVLDLNNIMISKAFMDY